VLQEVDKNLAELWRRFECVDREPHCGDPRNGIPRQLRLIRRVRPAANAVSKIQALIVRA